MLFPARPTSRLNQTGRILVGLTLALLVTGCASVSITPTKEVVIDRMPKRIYVSTFSISHAEFNVDREGKELTEFKRNIQKMMKVAIITDLSDRLIPARAMSRGSSFHPEHAWLVTGRFVLVNQGSRFLRGAIGFGAGGTKMKTKVEVYDLSEDSGSPFLTFSTVGGSNAEPGAITAVATDPLTIVVEAAASSVGGIAHGITEDTQRTAREITAELSDYMFQRGWISDEKWIKPKHVDK